MTGRRINKFLGMHIVVVDDDPLIGELVCDILIQEGARAKAFLSGEEFFDYLEREIPDMIILDKILPGMNGFDICRKLRNNEKFSLLPIIMLSGSGDVIDKVDGLDVGADDYVTKPFDAEELKARIRALLRRRGPGGEPEILQVGDILTVDLRRCSVEVRSKKIDLTFAEFKILECLLLNRTQVLSRNRLLEYLWGDDKIVVQRTIDFHIRNIRKKLGKAGTIIKNIRGFGYCIE